MKVKSEILRCKILSAADCLFQKYGLNKTTMEDIAREAGKGKSTLYYYFKSKEEIFDAIIQDEKNKFFDQAQKLIAAAPSARQKMEAFCKSRLLRIKEVTNLYEVMINEVREMLGNGQMTDPTLKYRTEHNEKEIRILKGILQYGVATKEFRFFTEKELDIMAFVLMSANHGLELDLILYNRVDDVDGKVNFLNEMMMIGIMRQ